MLSVFRVNDDDCYKWPGLYISSAPYLIWICVHQYINVRPNLASSIPPPPPLKYLYLTWLPLQFVWLHCKRQKFGLWLQRTRGMPDCILYRDTIEYKNPSECDDGHPTQGGFDGRGQRSCKCNYVEFYSGARPPCWQLVWGPAPMLTASSAVVG